MLSDIEICKRIAEISFNEPVNCYQHEFDGICIDRPMCGMMVREKYNPLTDDSLCFQLMVKYRLEVWEANGKWLVGFNLCNTVSDESPNKAICLAIIEAHKDSQ